MNTPFTIFLISAAYLGIFAETRFEIIRMLFRCQIDILPPLMVFASLRLGLTAVALLAVVGGLLFDSLSANPLGLTTLSLFIVGWFIHVNSGFLLREERYAQFVLGMSCSLAVPLISLAVLSNSYEGTLWSSGLVWSLFVNVLAGGLLTPLICSFLQKIESLFNYQEAPELSYRSDREIKRGR